MKNIEKRKAEHVRIAVSEAVGASYNFWNDVFLVHKALPEIAKDDVGTSIKFLGKNLGSPIIITGMTGGFRDAEKINKNLAEAAAEMQIGFGTGSQRAALEKPELARTYSVVKDYAVPLKIANIGAPQILRWGKRSYDMTQKAIDMIDADAIAVHLNFLQESTQPEGETDASGCLGAIKDLVKSMEVPVIIKETGAGISYQVAKALCKTGISGIDISGLGGTSFSAVEYYRIRDEKKRIGKTFWNWGIPSPVSLIETRKACSKPLIASGGIESGLDIAKAISLGADAAGIARIVLRPAISEKTKRALELIIEELKIAMFLTGSKDIEKLRKARYYLTGVVRDMVEGKP